MRTYFTSDIDKIGLTEERWNSIASKSETNTIFQTYQWFQSWWKVFEDKYQLFFISVRDKDEVIGFAPLMLSTDAKGNRTLMFTGEGNSDYSDFIIKKNKEEVLKRIFDTIYIKNKEWDGLFLNNIPEYSSTFEILSKKCAYVCNKMIINNNICCPTLLINGNKPDAINIANKNSLKRRYNYFKKNGKLAFFNIDNLNDAEKYLEKFIEQHITRWSLTKHPSLFLNYKNRDFYKELMINIFDKSWLLFSVLEFNNHPIAFHFGFDYNSKVIWYKPSFDINYKKNSPGIVLIKYLLEYSINNAKDELDFTFGDEQFKNRFTNKRRKNIQLMIFKEHSRFLFELTKSYTKRFIKKASNKQQIKI